MNIFILDEDIKKSAMYHVDKHCVKMMLEHSQMLCTVLTINQELRDKLAVDIIPYKKSHMNHPCTVWVAQSYDNFAWLVAYTHELHEEYKYRYKREHKSYLTLSQANIITDKIIEHGRLLCITDLSPVAVMPDECKTDSVVDSYRKYYRQYKSQIFSWTGRDVPDWILCS